MYQVIVFPVCSKFAHIVTCRVVSLTCCRVVIKSFNFVVVKIDMGMLFSFFLMMDYVTVYIYIQIIPIHNSALLRMMDFLNKYIC